MKKLLLSLVIVIMSGSCSSSSNSQADMQTTGAWQSMGIANAVYLNVLTLLGDAVAVGGTEADLDAAVWLHQKGAWSGAYGIQGLKAGVHSQAAAEDGTLYLGVTSPLSGHVYRFMPGTREFQNLKLEGARKVYELAMLDGVLYASGVQQTASSGSGTGEVWQYRDGQWRTLGVPGYNVVDAMAVSQGVLFIGLKDNTAAAKVLAYEQSGWTDTGFPSHAVNIGVMISGGQGVLYAAGIDRDHTGQVWRYKNGQWTSMGLQGSVEVRALAIGQSGVLYAGGRAGGSRGQVWSFAMDTWQATGLSGAASIRALSVGPDNALLAAGQDVNNRGQVWIYRK